MSDRLKVIHALAGRILEWSGPDDGTFETAAIEELVGVIAAAREEGRREERERCAKVAEAMAYECPVGTPARDMAATIFARIRTDDA